LRCISRCGVGVDAIDLAAARQRGVVIANTPGIPTAAVAELALAMFLSLSRNIRLQANLMQARRWERTKAHLLAGRTVGIIGLGRIGQRVAQLCLALNAQVLAYDPLVDTTLARGLGVVLVPMERLLREADIISLHASRSTEQPILIGSMEMAVMKRGTILVNLARGEMVDEDALVEALRSGQLAGAGLDVFGVEPYQGPLCDFEQVILTPHSATLTVETRAAMELQCVENALDFLSGNLSNEQRVI
jgi:D-3-phosphoglycerate dehydrogenase